MRIFVIVMGIVVVVLIGILLMRVADGGLSPLNSADFGTAPTEESQQQQPFENEREEFLREMRTDPVEGEPAEAEPQIPLPEPVERPIKPLQLDKMNY